MQIRRPMAGLFVTLALIGGGALTGCGSDPEESRTGTPADSATDSSAANPSDKSQVSVPNNSDKDQGNKEDLKDDNHDPDGATQPARSVTQRQSRRPVQRS